MKKKETVDALEFRGGYALLTTASIEAILIGYREGLIKKDAVRVFAARAEKSALHAKSKVDLSRILNSKSSLEGIKRLRRGVIKKVGEDVDRVLSAAPQGSQRRRCASRKAIRAIAQGRLSCTESIVLLMYFMKRITQTKPMKRLEAGERYARFTYRELEELSGIPKANISRTVHSLKQKGLIGTVWVVKQNENQFGLLFVDGPALTLIPGTAADRSNPEKHKSTTPPERINNAPVIKLPTLINTDPKRDIKEKKTFLKIEEKEGRGSYSSDWERILARARAIKENLSEQAA